MRCSCAPSRPIVCDRSGTVWLLTENERRSFDDYEYREVRPVRRYYAEPRVVYADRYAEPWTRDWYEYCSDRYRTFNARSGTFTGNDGEQHFCTAN